MSLRDIDNVQCDWSLEGSDLRAFVQSTISEANRHNLGTQVEPDICVRTLQSARVTLNARITMDEYRSAKRRMNSGKAVGLDGVPFELFRGVYNGDIGMRTLVSSFDDLILHTFNTILANGRYVPGGMETSCTSPTAERRRP